MSSFAQFLGAVGMFAFLLLPVGVGMYIIAQINNREKTKNICSENAVILCDNGCGNVCLVFNIWEVVELNWWHVLNCF